MSKHVVIIGGFGETQRTLSSVTREIKKLGHTVEIITWREYHKFILNNSTKRIQKKSDNKDVVIISHSIGAIYAAMLEYNHDNVKKILISPIGFSKMKPIPGFIKFVTKNILMLLHILLSIFSLDFIELKNLALLTYSGGKEILLHPITFAKTVRIVTSGQNGYLDIANSHKVIPMLDLFHDDYFEENTFKISTRYGHDAFVVDRKFMNSVKDLI